MKRTMILGVSTLVLAIASAFMSKASSKFFATRYFITSGGLCQSTSSTCNNLGSTVCHTSNNTGTRTLFTSGTVGASCSSVKLTKNN